MGCSSEVPEAEGADYRHPYSRREKEEDSCASNCSKRSRTREPASDVPEPRARMGDQVMNLIYLISLA